MLYENSVSKPTLELLSQLMAEKAITNFYLAGGTALALQIGHRISVDLDFFSNKPFQSKQLAELFSSNKNVRINNVRENTLGLSFDKIKVEFLSHQYPFLSPIKVVENIRLASLEDIAAMKINAIVNRGSKKDFVDVYFLLEYFQIENILDFAIQKYSNMNQLLILKSLTYFDDADTQPDLIMIKKVTWEKVKEEIISQVKALNML